ncbi:penicillin-binding protein [Fusarium pseudoanthophilum]|uniref:Penicillin-binding protein n=1 Tax=Fusarium pseudoanthophilum TaxID=48495 RepID=A0A8H5NQK7_9HYPO|nr:penicillin-binding protein [Fusarium pseudoanthophilum]
MADITDRIHRMSYSIERLMAISGTPGVAIGVMIKDNPISYNNHGFRDVERKLPVTEDTIFPICSLTKGITAVGIGLLVEEKRVSWDSLIKDILPDFCSVNPVLHNNTTITDILCHRTGMGWGDNAILGTADLSSGHSVLNLATTTSTTNWLALSFNDALENASTVPIDFLRMGDGGYGAASGGARSSVKDLVKLYSSFIKGFNTQFSGSATPDDGSPLKQLNHIMSAKIPFNQPSQHEASSAFGWGKVQLPGRFGHIGLNPALLLDMPTIGRGTSSLVLFHQGSLPGSLTFVALLPETETVIVVLTNSLALNDAADWIGQLIIEDIVNVPSELRTDFIGLAQAAVAKNLKCHSQIVDDKLYWLMYGLETEMFELVHYHEDTFTWLQPRDELVSRGRWVRSGQGATFWEVKFEASESATIDKLIWVPDSELPPMAYTKTRE